MRSSAESMAPILPSLLAIPTFHTPISFSFCFQTSYTVLVFSGMSLSEESFKAVPCFCGSIWLSNDAGKLVSRPHFARARGTASQSPPQVDYRSKVCRQSKGVNTLCRSAASRNRGFKTVHWFSNDCRRKVNEPSRFASRTRGATR